MQKDIFTIVLIYYNNASLNCSEYIS